MHAPMRNYMSNLATYVCIIFVTLKIVKQKCPYRKLEVLSSLVVVCLIEMKTYRKVTASLMLR